MDRRAIEVTFLSTLSAGGVAAVIGSLALPADSPYFNFLIIGGSIAIAVGIIGLAWLWLTAPKKSSPPKPTSTFISGDGSGEYDLADIETGADTFADVKGTTRMVAKNVRHVPTSKKK